MEIAQATARNFGATARRFELRFNAGIVAKTEVMQITSQHRQALAAIPAFEQAIGTRNDTLYEVGGGLNWQFAPIWSLNPETLSIRDQSNLLAVNFGSFFVLTGPHVSWYGLKKGF